MAKHHQDTDGSLADRAWCGFHPRGAVPTVALAVVASVTLVVGRWWFRDISAWADQIGALVYYALALAVWPLLAFRTAYRMVTYTYRLTDRAVLVDFGPRHPPEPPVWFADLTGVASGAGWLGRLLGVGDVTITAGGRTVTLVGVRNPEAFAALVRDAAHRPAPA